MERISVQLEHLQSHQTTASALSEAQNFGASSNEQSPKRQAANIAATTATAAVPAMANAESAACPGRKPFHTLMTAQASVYQQWQSRIAYFHWKKQAAAGGKCTDMVAFHRLCATAGGKPDGLEREIPTLFTVQLSEEVLSKHFGFGVLNRPNSVIQLLASEEMKAKLLSPFVLIMETGVALDSHCCAA